PTQQPTLFPYTTLFRSQLAVVEPFEEGCIRFIEHSRERLVPEHVLPAEPAPEAFEIATRLVAQRLIGRCAGHVGLLDELGGRRKQPVLLEYGLDRCVGHLQIPPVEVLILPAPERPSQPGANAGKKRPARGRFPAGPSRPPGREEELRRTVILQ